MADTDFIARIAARDRGTASPSMPPQLPKARNRKERIAKALLLLEREGIAGSTAYSPVFRGLRAVGLGPKPFFWWNPIGLTLFMFVFFVVLFAGALVLSLALGVMPRPIRGMVEAGPTFFFALNGVLAIAFTVYHKITAIRLALPRWRDL
jgi:hypothetical protein